MSKLPKLKTNQELIYSDLTYRIRRALFSVYNTLGSGHKEQVYQKALERELQDLGIPDAQLLHYLKTTGFKLGLLINFGAPKIFIKRLIWTNQSGVSVKISNKSV